MIDFNLRILVVDDMPAMRSIVRNMLLEIGFTRIVEAEDADQAWERIRFAIAPGGDPEGAFGLVVSDWNMPGMSGAELLRAVRGLSQTRDLAFLMVTAERSPDHLSEATHAGVTDYVIKPFNLGHLREKIDGIFATLADGAEAPSG